MIKKSDAKFFFTDDTFDKILKKAIKTGHTRFLVLYKPSKKVVGFVNVKNLFEYIEKRDEFSIDKILREALFINQNENLRVAERKLKIEKKHMACIVDRNERFVGLITLEDIIEEIFGEIEDEFDTD